MTMKTLELIPSITICTGLKMGEWIGSVIG
jgi:hypothetical protein